MTDPLEWLRPLDLQLCKVRQGNVPAEGMMCSVRTEGKRKDRIEKREGIVRGRQSEDPEYNY